jgi:pimeloyl-ACP methyl ester carboxylesterase
MPNFYHGEVEITYLDEGTGDPIVLVHGLASTEEVNWGFPANMRLLINAIFVT